MDVQTPAMDQVVDGPLTGAEIGLVQDSFAMVEPIAGIAGDTQERIEEPAEGIKEDGFATLSQGSGNFEKGEYIIHVTSDDGVKLFLDDIEILKRWDIHVPTTDEIEVSLDGEHHFKIIHFEGGGLGNLVFTIKPKQKF